MNKVTKFDRKTCREIEDGAVAALQEFAKARGLSVTYGGGSFGEGNFTARIKFAVADPEASTDIARREWSTYCALFGLGPEHFGVKIMTSRGLGVVSGFDLRRRKYPIRIKFGDKEIAFTDDIVAKIKASAIARDQASGSKV